MSQSTPINMIRRNGTSDGGSQISIPDMGNMDPMSSDSQLVEDILKEMGDSPGAELQSNINSQALQYAMDSSQVPPTKYNPPQHNEPMMDYNNYSQKMMMDQNQNGILGQLGINLGGDTLRDKIMKNIKYPAIVFVLCFLIITGLFLNIILFSPVEIKLVATFSLLFNLLLASILLSFGSLSIFLNTIGLRGV